MRRPLTPLALLAAACSLRPYTFDSASGDASSTTTSSASSTGTTSTTTTTGSVATTTTTAATTSGGPVPGTWQGHYHVEDELYFDNHLFLDCATDQTLELVGDAFPKYCGEAWHGDGLYLRISGILHPDGDDDDLFEELEVTALLADPCLAGSCADPFDWSSCGPWPDVCGSQIGCDVWSQDCPEGHKCVAYSSCDGCSWDSTKCVLVIPDADGLGEPCTVEGDQHSGIDSCTFGHICWTSPYTDVDTCLAQCTGKPDTPTCPDCSGCVSGGNGGLIVCLPDCSPLLQDCGDDQPCVPYPGLLDSFVCGLDFGDNGVLFEPCEYADSCKKGLWCAPPEHATECDPNAPGCCLPFCDLTQPACLGAGLECVPWNDQAPPCSANVGTCRLPP